MTDLVDSKDESISLSKVRKLIYALERDAQFEEDGASSKPPTGLNMCFKMVPHIE